MINIRHLIEKSINEEVYEPCRKTVAGICELGLYITLHEVIIEKLIEHTRRGRLAKWDTTYGQLAIRVHPVAYDHIDDLQMPTNPVILKHPPAIDLIDSIGKLPLDNV